MRRFIYLSIGLVLFSSFLIQGISGKKIRIAQAMGASSFAPGGSMGIFIPPTGQINFFGGVVNGSGVLTFNTTINSLLNNFNHQNTTPDPVTTGNGTLTFSVKDFSYNRQGFPLCYERFYNTRFTSLDRELGDGWSSNYDQTIYLNPSGYSATFLSSNGSFNFIQSGGGWTRPPGGFFLLESIAVGSIINIPVVDAVLADPSTNGMFKLTDKYGIVTYFAAMSPGSPNVFRPVFQVDLNGNSLTYQYESYARGYTLGTTYATGGASSQLPGSNGPPTYDPNCENIYGEPCIYNYNPNTGFTPSPSPDQGSVGGPTTNPIVAYYILELRLKNVIAGPVTWSLTFNYDDADKIEFNSRLINVKNNLGDEIDFQFNPTGVANNPITGVARVFSGVNATYSYQSWVDPADPTNNTIKYFLASRQDALAQAGARNRSYTYKLDPSTGEPLGVYQEFNGRGNLLFQFDIPFSTFMNTTTPIAYTSTLRNNALQIISEDTYQTGSDLGPQLVSIQRYINNSPVPYPEIYQTYNGDGLVSDLVDGNNHHTQYTYDSNGNVTSILDAEGITQSFVYDGFSRITHSVDGRSIVRDFIYDPVTENLLQIIEPGRKTNFSCYSGGLLHTIQDANLHTTQFVYDGLHVVAEYTGGTLVATFTYGRQLDELLAVRRGGATRFIQQDGIGSVRRTVDGDGTVSGSATYDTFGRQTAGNLAGISPLGFHAREFDETGLYNFRARNYDPDSGRFLSEDQMGVVSEPNLYAFVRTTQ